ncbi:MAG: PH domain-containing protein [Acidobacteriota bacterium]
MESTQCVGRKHKIVYLWLAFTTALLVLLCLSALTVPDVQRNLSGLVFLIVVVLLIRALAKWLYLRSFSWTVMDEQVVIKRGWLPWRKLHFEIPIDTVFEAYYTFGLFGRLFNFGHCTLRRTEGVTSEFSETYMARAEELVRLINRKVREFKKQQKQAPSVSTRSEVEELKELALLKADGSISAQEYETLKRKIVNRSG